VKAFAVFLILLIVGASLVYLNRGPDTKITQAERSAEINGVATPYVDMRVCTRYVIDVYFRVEPPPIEELVSITKIVLYVANAQESIFNKTEISDVKWDAGPDGFTYRARFLFHPVEGLIKSFQCLTVNLSGTLEFTVSYTRFGETRRASLSLPFDIGAIRICA